MNVLVTGVTGFVGRHLAPELVAAGHDVRGLTRDRTAHRESFNEHLELVEGNLLDPTSLDGLFDDIDVVYYLVHSLGAGTSFERTDREAAHNFVTAASESGVSRVIYLGGLGNSETELSAHLRSRREIEAVLADGSYDLTTFRAAVIIGSGSVGFDMIVQLVERLPVMIAPRWVRTDTQPIAIADVIEYLVRAVEVPETAGRTLEIGGPEVLTYREMMRRVAAAKGERLYLFSVPFLTPRLSTYWIDLFTDMPPSVTRALIEGLRNSVVVTDDTARELLDVDPTPFDVAVRQALGGRE